MTSIERERKPAERKIFRLEKKRKLMRMLKFKLVLWKKTKESLKG